jgi:transcriptional regulator with XRE-family HTH domain
MPDSTKASSQVLERIEIRLDRMGLTATKVMKAVGLPTSLLEDLRTGKANVPRGQRLLKLADALGTSVGYLVGLDPDAPPPPEMLQEDQGSLGLLASDEAALLGAYRRLPVPSRAAALHVILKMAGPEVEPTVASRKAV